MEQLKEIFTKIAGNTFIDHGQDHLKALTPGDRLKYLREPTNKFDIHAIALYNITGDKLGYIPRDIALNLSKDIDMGNIIEIFVNEITGKNQKNVGCNILIGVFGDALPTDTFKLNGDMANEFNENNATLETEDDSPFGDYNYHKDNDLKF